MRQINVTKKVKVAMGEALIVDLSTEGTGWEPFETRNTEYPLVGINARIGKDFRAVAVRNVKVIEKRYGMPLEAFIAAATFSEECVDPIVDTAVDSGEEE